MPALSIAPDSAQLRETIASWRQDGATIGFVPTMGALHAGHLSLIKRALAETDRVVASIFVNPKQFSPGEDLAAYPRGLERDRQMLEDAGCALLFAPQVADIYPEGFATSVSVSGLTEGLDGATRPNFFGGIATVVAKLFILVAPDKAFFGEKDYQQLLVVRRMTTDLGLPVEVIGCPTVRDPDGLAMSSRNVYLSPAERQQALVLPQTLTSVAEAIAGGADIAKVLRDGCATLEAAGFRLDYLELRDAETLAPLRHLSRPARLFVGGYLGKTRLIDNVPVSRKG
jgi:pantoate--beta-alanine ligase